MNSYILFSKRKREGFTLLELLVVISIIIILITIIVVSVMRGRDRAKDKAIIADLGQLRKAAEDFYVAQDGYQGICDPSDDTLSNTGKIGEIERDINKNGGEMSCQDSASEYAVSASLQLGGYWCVDAKGTSRKISSPVTTTVCP